MGLLETRGFSRKGFLILVQVVQKDLGYTSLQLISSASYLLWKYG